MALIDLKGKVFGRLTVLYRDCEAEKKRKGRNAMWKCQCSCGNITTVVGKDLRAGKTQSCGCLQKERTSQSNGKKLFTGQRFGLLTILSQEPSKNQRTYWRCRCDCGNEIVVCLRELSSGDTSSCGCIKSKGQAKIQKLLTELKFDYKTEICFSDFKTKEQQYYRFDFGIYKDSKLLCLIEYDGKQHFSFSGGWNSEEQFKLTQKRDKIKTEYCKNNNIPLIRIPYYDYEKIDQAYLKERIEKYV